MKIPTPYRILDEIAKEHIPNDIDLSEKILMRIRKEKQIMKRSRIVIVFSLLLGILLFATIKVPVVAHVIKQLFGYYPGSGLVEMTGEIYVLDEPVIRNYDDTTVSILQIEADKIQTIVTLQIEHLPSSKNSPQGEMRNCSELPTLILPDGTSFNGTSTTMDVWTTGYRRRITYPAMPENGHIGRLRISCLELTSATIGDEGWSIPFELVPAPDNISIYPIENYPTPTSKSEIEDRNLINPGDTLPDFNDFHLFIQQTVKTEDEILFMGKMLTDIPYLHMLFIEPEAIHLRDSMGKEIAIEEDYDILETLNQSGSVNEIQMAYHVFGNYQPGMGTLNVDSVWFSVDYPIEFTLDVGENPQIDQEWMLDLPIEFAGRKVRITSVKKNENGYTFEVDDADDFHIITILDKENEELGGGGSSDLISVSYNGAVPSGELRMLIPGFEIRVNGPWQVDIELPYLQNQRFDPTDNKACLTVDQWSNLLQENPVSDLQSGMGKLILYQLVGPEYHYWIGEGNLENSQTKLFSKGEDPALSPDGNHVVYVTEQGLSIMDIETGETILIDGTTKMDRGPIWSPDGSKIVYTHGPESGLIDGPGTYQLMLTHLDGNSPKTLLENADANIAQAWAPDGKSIYFIVKGADGANVKNLMFDSGAIQSIFTIAYINAGVSISPDGKKWVYEDMLPGERYAIVVADIDGNHPTVIADMYPLVATHPIWSPDGEWLLISVHDTNISEINPILAMINWQTCEVIPMTDFSGYVNTWIP